MAVCNQPLTQPFPPATRYLPSRCLDIQIVQCLASLVPITRPPLRYRPHEHPHHYTLTHNYLDHIHHYCPLATHDGVHIRLQTTSRQRVLSGKLRLGHPSLCDLPHASSPARESHPDVEGDPRVDCQRRIELLDQSAQCAGHVLSSPRGTTWSKSQGNILPIHFTSLHLPPIVPLRAGSSIPLSLRHKEPSAPSSFLNDQYAVAQNDEDFVHSCYFRPSRSRQYEL